MPEKGSNEKFILSIQTFAFHDLKRKEAKDDNDLKASGMHEMATRKSPDRCT